jgi:tRNA 2-selenouridine synthase
VFVEAESKKVGNLTVPESLMLAMRASPCLLLQLSDDERVALLLEDYAFFANDPEFFCQRLDALTTLRGKAVVEGWKALVRAGDLEPVVRDLLLNHYDPGYATSTRRNFTGFADAPLLTARDRSMEAMRELASTLAGAPGAA